MSLQHQIETKPGFRPPEPATLTELLTAAVTRVDRHHQSVSSRAQYDRETDRRRGVVAQRTREAKSAADDLQQWESDWRAAITPLPLKDMAASVATVREYVRKIKDMQGHLKEERIKRSRLREIDELRRTFFDRLTVAKQALDGTAAPCHVDAIDNEFRDIHDAAASLTQQREAWTRLTADRNAILKKLAKTREECTKAETEVAALLSEAGAAETHELPSLQGKVRERDGAEKRLHEMEAALAGSAAGIPLDAYITAALEARDGLAVRIDNLDATVEELETDIEAADVQARHSETVLVEHRKGSAEAAEARQQMALTADTLREGAFEYVARHVALAALQRAVESYRARNADSMLTRAAKFFRLLTGGAFTGIDIDNDEGEDVLVGLRAAAAVDRPDTRVRVDGFSAGTRDQLFLALRLAGIEQHISAREPMPLILDDLLVNFDDHRSATTLTCLAELARRTQVLLFTHHRHVVELARQTVPSVHISNLLSSK